MYYVLTDVQPILLNIEPDKSLVTHDTTGHRVAAVAAVAAAVERVSVFVVLQRERIVQ